MNSGVSILIIFAVMILILNLTRKLYFGIAGGIVAAVLCFSIPVGTAAGIAGRSVVSPDTLQMVLVLYAITFLQRMLERNGDIVRSQKAMDALSGNRRINTCLSPIIIGFLPAVAVVKICGDIVTESAGDYLDRNEKTFVTSYYRHLSESFLPTYTSILLAVGLSGVGTSSFVIGMLPMVLVQVMLGYVFYLRKMPTETGTPPSTDRKRDMMTVFQGIWSLLLVIALILAFRIPVLPAVGISVALYIIINRVPLSVLSRMLVTAFDAKLIVNMFLIYIFKDIITYTGVIGELPVLFSALPIPQFLVFMMIFFFGALIGGSNMIHSIGIPLAFTAIPDGGMPLLVLLCCSSYMAMQISPTHICLEVVVDHFGATIGGLVKKTMPVMVCYLAIAILYYLVLSALGI